MFIGISGTIAVGKSTIAKFIADHYKFTLIEESVKDHPTLSDFYISLGNFNATKPHKYPGFILVDMYWQAFRTQMYFLQDRYKKHKVSVFGFENIVADRLIYEDLIFAKMLRDRGEMHKTDFEIYLSHAQIFMAALRPPNLTVILQASNDVLMERQKKRGRDIEKIDWKYMSDLNVKYLQWAKDYPYEKIIINTDKKNYVDNKQDLEELLVLINDHVSNLGVAEMLFV